MIAHALSFHVRFNSFCNTLTCFSKKEVYLLYALNLFKYKVLDK